MTHRKRSILLLVLTIAASLSLAIATMHNSAGPRSWNTLTVTVGIGRGCTCAFFMAIYRKGATETPEKSLGFSILRWLLWLGLLLLAALDAMSTTLWWGLLWVSFGICLTAFGKLCPRSLGEK